MENNINDILKDIRETMYDGFFYKDRIRSERIRYCLLDYTINQENREVIQKIYSVDYPDSIVTYIDDKTLLVFSNVCHSEHIVAATDLLVDRFSKRKVG